MQTWQKYDPMPIIRNIMIAWCWLTEIILDIFNPAFSLGIFYFLWMKVQYSFSNRSFQTKNPQDILWIGDSWQCLSLSNTTHVTYRVAQYSSCALWFNDPT